jgi:hypothetical protein
MEASTDLDQVADAHGFIIAYLGSPAPEWQHSNDLAYIGSMITWLTSHYSVDPSRVYVVGFSLGGYATFRTVCQYSNRLAGIAVVSQVMAPLSRRPCKLSRPVSQLAIVGSKDAVPLHASAAKPVSADQTATIWRGLDGCSTKSVTSQSPPVLQTVWSQCTDGTKVGEYVVQGGVHTWPLNRPALATRSPDYRYNASAALWSFLSPLRASPNTVDAQLLSLTVTGSAGHRSLVVRVRSGEQLSFKQTLSLRRHVLAVKRYRLGAGPQVRATSRIPRYLKAGRYAVTLSAIDGYGRKLNLVRTIRVPG